MAKGVERDESLNALGGSGWDLSSIPPAPPGADPLWEGRPRPGRSPTSVATGAWPPVAFASVMPQGAADEAIEVFDLVMGDDVIGSALPAPALSPPRPVAEPRARATRHGSARSTSPRPHS